VLVDLMQRLRGSLNLFTRSQRTRIALIEESIRRDHS
jgi:hypothetical protein